MIDWVTSYLWAQEGLQRAQERRASLLRQDGSHPLLQALQADVEEAYRKAYPRRNGGPPWTSTGETLRWDSKMADRFPGFLEILEAYRPKSQRLLRLYNVEIRRYESMAQEAAAQVAPADLAAPGVWTRYGEVPNASYTSQGFGMERYAQARAQATLHALEVQGLEGTVRRVERPGYGSRCTTWEVWVNVQPDRVDLLRRAVEERADPVDFVRWCWGAGVNPRVYLPFLEVGFEEAHGISYLPTRG